MKQTSVALFVLLLFSTMLSTRVPACTYFPPSYKVGPGFTVEVSSEEGMKFAGIRVILVRANRVAKAALTDKKGAAQFDGVAAGDYSLDIDQLGGAGWNTAELKVLDSGGVQNIAMRWPNGRFLRAASVSGRLLNGNTGQPVRETSLQLVDGLNGRLEARLITDKDGGFDLGSPEPGLYFIKVESLWTGNWEPRGDIPVLVSGQGSRDFALALEETSCGMVYSEVCAASPTTVSRLQGTVSDEMGAVIDRGTVELVSGLKDHQTVTSVQLDGEGRFKIDTVKPGQYQLRISSVGFTPFVIPMKVDPIASGEGPFRIQLSVMGNVCHNDVNPRKDSVN